MKGRITIDGAEYVHSLLFQAVSDQNLEMGLAQNHQRKLMNDMDREIGALRAKLDQAIRDAQDACAQRADLAAKVQELHIRLMNAT